MRWAYIVITVLTIILGAFQIVQYNTYLYHTALEQVHADASEHIIVSDGILSYLEGNDDLPSGFIEREISHLSDVKSIMQASLLVFWLLLLGWLIHTKVYGWLGKELFLSGVILVLLPILVAIIPFDIAFDVFHRFFFAPGTWVFETSDLLIKTYPLAFFETMGMYIGTVVFGSGIVLGSIGWSITKLK